ncbi:MAG: universal stress protein [Candidatus Dormibacteria bacterium]
MFKSVVVGTDGSPTAGHALLKAIDIARASGATLHLVCAAPTPVSATLTSADVAGLGSWSLPQWEADVLGELNGVLSEAARVAGRVVTVETHSRIGDPAQAILEVAAEKQADLIVVGNKGMRGARRLLGSVPNHITHHAPCSVLVIRTT